MRGVRRLAVVAVAVAAEAMCAARVDAQTIRYDDALLQDVRALTHAVPGALPTTVGYLSAQDDTSPASDAVAGAAHTRVAQPTPVFQIRYPRGWIMVDAGMTRAMAHAQGGQHFADDRYAEMTAALRGAGLIVVTHEHPDHVGTLVQSPIAVDLAPHTLLTREQVEMLVHQPKLVFISLDSVQARRYLVVEYERLLPIAPGVVLIRAPGHTPGSQMVYVTLASGREILLSGDVAWLKQGIDSLRQKPDSASRTLHENRATIADEIAWLAHTVEPAGIAVVVSHDGAELEDLHHRGILSQGLDLHAP